MDKNFNRIFVALAVAFSCLAVKSAWGGSAVITPKKSFNLSYSVAMTTVVPTVQVSTFGVAPAAQYYPGAVYEVVQGTGAGVAEFFMMYDSSFTQNVAGTTISCGQMSGLPLGVSALVPHMVYSSTTTTVTRFDPPLLFENGLVVCNSAVTGSASVTFEPGRGLSGY